jgi:hypothetical protein
MRYFQTLTISALAAFLIGCGKPIPIEIHRQRDFVQYIVDSQPQTQGKGKVSIDENNRILIELDVFVGELAPFRESFVNVRKGTSDYIKQEARPFIIKTRNETFSIPEK